jgi:hypothetical protein
MYRNGDKSRSEAPLPSLLKLPLVRMITATTAADTSTVIPGRGETQTIPSNRSTRIRKTTIHSNTPSTIVIGPPLLPSDRPSGRASLESGIPSGKAEIEMRWVESRNGRKTSEQEVLRLKTVLGLINVARRTLIRQADTPRSPHNTKMTKVRRRTPVIRLPRLNLQGIDTDTTDTMLPQGDA